MIFVTHVMKLVFLKMNKNVLLVFLVINMIIYFHMLKELQALEIYSAEAIHHFYKNPNANIAKLAVAVLFMLSGAGLALGTQTSLDFKQDKSKNINKRSKRRLRRNGADGRE